MVPQEGRIPRYRARSGRRCGPVYSIIFTDDTGA
jgi:hypothetical protein